MLKTQFCLILVSLFSSFVWADAQFEREFNNFFEPVISKQVKLHDFLEQSNINADFIEDEYAACADYIGAYDRRFDSAFVDINTTKGVNCLNSLKPFFLSQRANPVNNVSNIEDLCARDGLSGLLELQEKLDDMNVASVCQQSQIYLQKKILENHFFEQRRMFMAFRELGNNIWDPDVVQKHMNENPGAFSCLNESLREEGQEDGEDALASNLSLQYEYFYGDGDKPGRIECEGMLSEIIFNDPNSIHYPAASSLASDPLQNPIEARRSRFASLRRKANEYVDQCASYGIKLPGTFQDTANIQVFTAEDIVNYFSDTSDRNSMYRSKPKTFDDRISESLFRAKTYLSLVKNVPTNSCVAGFDQTLLNSKESIMDGDKPQALAVLMHNLNRDCEERTKRLINDLETMRLPTNHPLFENDSALAAIVEREKRVCGDKKPKVDMQKSCEVFATAYFMRPSFWEDQCRPQVDRMQRQIADNQQSCDLQMNKVTQQSPVNCPDGMINSPDGGLCVCPGGTIDSRFEFERNSNPLTNVCLQGEFNFTIPEIDEPSEFELDLLGDRIITDRCTIFPGLCVEPIYEVPETVIGGDNETESEGSPVSNVEPQVPEQEVVIDTQADTPVQPDTPADTPVQPETPSVAIETEVIQDNTSVPEQVLAPSETPQVANTQVSDNFQISSAIEDESESSKFNFDLSQFTLTNTNEEKIKELSNINQDNVGALQELLSIAQLPGNENLLEILREQVGEDRLAELLSSEAPEEGELNVVQEENKRLQAQVDEAWQDLRVARERQINANLRERNNELQRQLAQKSNAAPEQLSVSGSGESSAFQITRDDVGGSAVASANPKPTEAVQDFMTPTGRDVIDRSVAAVAPSASTGTGASGNNASIKYVAGKPVDEINAEVDLSIRQDGDTPITFRVSSESGGTIPEIFESLEKEGKRLVVGDLIETEGDVCMVQDFVETKASFYEDNNCQKLENGNIACCNTEEVKVAKEQAKDNVIEGDSYCSGFRACQMNNILEIVGLDFRF